MKLDLTGQRFGKLLVESRSPNIGSHSAWFCVCDCGNRLAIRTHCLRRGQIGCGCTRNPKGKAHPSYKHGHAPFNGNHSRTHRVWAGMLERCRNPNRWNYAFYGARGITVCERWVTFENFLADMGECPDGHSIDRIDNNGNYEPGNCRWTTRKQQARNKNNCRYLDFRGERKPMIQWAEELNLSYAAVQLRLDRGWSVEQTLTTPAKPFAPRVKRASTSP